MTGIYLRGRIKMGKHRFFIAVMTLLAGISLASMIDRLGRAHEEHGVFSAGEPGDPSKPARVITVEMFIDGKQKLFAPTSIEVRRGEQVRFVLENDDADDHEFVLATVAENQEHAEYMKKHPGMDHNMPNAKRVRPFQTGELLWKFTKPGEFEFACLISDHYEAGMHGIIEVK
jgi:uncharacterized cupredoxin-like copper-binding protein